MVDMIDLDQWGGVKVSHINMLGKLEQNGLHEVVINNQKNYFYVENLDKIDSYDKIIFSFNGAVSNRGKKVGPFFTMLGVAKRLDVPVIAISDHSTMIHNTLGLAWYLGNEKFEKQVEFIAHNIYSVCKLTKKKPLLVGGSGGGFGALNIGHYLKNNLNMDATIFVWNPQTDVSKYYKKHVRNYVENAFSNNYSLSGLNPIEFLKKKVRYSDVLKKCDFSNLKVLYLQNKSDDHFGLHAIPFIKKNGLKEVKNNIYIYKDVYLLSPNWGDGHIAPDIIYIEDTIKKLMNNVDLKSIVVELDNLPYFNFFYNNEEENGLCIRGKVTDKNYVRSFNTKMGIHNVSISCNFDIKNLNVLIKVKAKNIQYCCYLYQDDQILERRSYNLTGNFTFNFDSFENGNYLLRIYIRDPQGNSKTSKNFDLGYFYKPSLYIKSKLENIKNENYASLGESLYLNRVLAFNKLANFKIVDDNIFSNCSITNRTWKWKLQQLEILLQLMSYHALRNKNDDILVTSMNYLRMWYEYTLTEASLNDSMLWHDHGTALRLRNIIFLLVYFLENKFISCFDDDYNFMINVIKIHINKLADEEFYSKYTNHGFDQSIFLFQASAEFKNLLSESLLVQKIARERVVNEANYAFCEDGGHKENSVGYLNFGIKQLLLAIDVLKNYDLCAHDLYMLLDKATNALTYAVKPNGYLPLIGDTSRHKVVDIFYGYQPKTYNQFKYAITDGKIGSKPLSSKLVLSDSGYAFFRSHWNKENFVDAIHLIIKASYKSNYHRHDDDLAVVLYGYGEDWLIDGGIYKYDEKNENRRYIRSSLSHNILSPVSAKVLRNKDSKHRVELKDIALNDVNKFHVIGQTEMFDGYLVTREIECIDLNKFLIKDICIKKDSSSFNIVSRFFFDMEKMIYFEDVNTLIVEGKTKKLRMEIECVHKLDIVVIESKDGSVDGWLSNDIGKLLKTQRVEIRNMNQIIERFDLKIFLSFI